MDKQTCNAIVAQLVYARSTHFPFICMILGVGCSSLEIGFREESGRPDVEMSYYYVWKHVLFIFPLISVLWLIIQRCSINPQNFPFIASMARLDLEPVPRYKEVLRTQVVKVSQDCSNLNWWWWQMTAFVMESVSATLLHLSMSTIIESESIRFLTIQCSTLPLVDVTVTKGIVLTEITTWHQPSFSTEETRSTWIPPILSSHTTPGDTQIIAVETCGSTTCWH